METFFILLVSVGVPFVWFIVRMLRFTKETVGEESPLMVERTYEVTVKEYFGTFSRIMNGLLTVMMLGLTILMIRVGIQQEPVVVVFAPFFLVSAGMFGFCIYLDWQYWHITRGVRVTFCPENPGISIDAPTWHRILTPDTLVRVEQYVANGSRLFAGYSYFLFYEADGQVTLLNAILFSNFSHYEFLEKYFPAVPITLVRQEIPWVKKMNLS
ncbi:hypothetical protein [Spirosoma spitsbergense]|uniref:hypothetical protein n=1 Tax=Spirosoma spitsbergense TaxID=431554 RepID=UPI00037A35B5|nr:hypothetical protein [Spirosoma spitsbergense]